MADAATGHADQTLPERARVKTILNRKTRAGAFQLAGRYGVKIYQQIVQTTAAGQPRVVSRFEIRA